jgi:hypothetical protein
MSSRGATPGLYHRTGTQTSFYQQISVPVRTKRGVSFNRDYVSFNIEENFFDKTLFSFSITKNY